RERRLLLVQPHRHLHTVVGHRGRVDQPAGHPRPVVAGRAGRQIDDVEPARDRLPPGGRQVDLLKHGRRQPAIHVANRLLELVEAGADGRHLLLEPGTGTLLLPQCAVEVGRGAQAGQNQQQHEQGPEPAPHHRVIFYMSMLVRGGRNALGLGALIAAVVLFGTVCSVDNSGLAGGSGGAGAGGKVTGGSGGSAGQTGGRGGGTAGTGSGGVLG